MKSREFLSTSQDSALLLISNEILEMAAEDQRMRSNRQWDGLPEIDRKNTEKMKLIVAKIGWPTVSKVGSQASEDAWLLVQHADHDVEFQEHCLSLMKQEPEREVLPKNIAYLEDRICVSRGRSQLYGTQFFTDDEGKFGPSPIVDMATLEQRRKEVGLGTFVEYKRGMESISQSMGTIPNQFSTS